MSVIHGVGSKFIVGDGHTRQVFQSDHICKGELNQYFVDFMCRSKSLSGKASQHDEVVPKCTIMVHGVGFKFIVGVKQYYIVTNDVGEGVNYTKKRYLVFD